MLQKSFLTSTETLADKRQVRVTVSTGGADRMGDVVDQGGIDLRNFKATRTILWNHDKNTPIASCADIRVVAAGLQALAQFPAPGVSAKSDEVYGLIKAGVVNAASIGFLPLESKPNAKGGRHYTKCELLEFSFVSVPANAGAVVVERGARGAVNHSAAALRAKRLREVRLAQVEVARAGLK